MTDDTDDALVERMARAIARADGDDAPDYMHRQQARAALAVVREAKGWRPIETAPKAWPPLGDEGAMSQRVLLANGNGSMFIGYWSDRDGGPGWWNDTSTHRRCFSEPTHWRPLPQPPEGGE